MSDRRTSSAKRGTYVPKLVSCPSCGGAGEHRSRGYPSGRAAVHVSTCGVCSGRGKMQPSSVTHAGDCTGCGGIYQCAGCRRWVGWCFGAADDMPDHCDDCWSKAHPAPKRRSAHV